MTYEMGPRSRRIHDLLRERIVGGELAPGTKLPSHTELAETYGAAPLTVRQVLAHLETEGLVLREQGRGTFVRQPMLPRVLIVEDDPHIGELLAEIARMSAAHPILATDVESARAALSR
jgi:DNA-binding GntR family transcriptional regulator